MKPVAYRDFKIIRRMPLNEFNRWLVKFYEAAYQDGIRSTEEGIAAQISEDQLRELLLSVKGIGQRRTDEAIQKILCAGKEAEG